MTNVRRIVAENRRVLWIIAAALVVNAALYALVVYPLSQRVYNEEQQAGDAIRNLNAARRTFASAQGTVTGKKQAEEELQKFYNDILPPDFSGARRILYPRLPQLAAKSNLTVRANLSPDSARATDVKKLSMTLTLSGDYASMRRFIHQLESAPEFLVLESVSVTQAPEGRELNVTAQVATYYRAGADGN